MLTDDGILLVKDRFSVGDAPGPSLPPRQGDQGHVRPSQDTNHYVPDHAASLVTDGKAR